MLLREINDIVAAYDDIEKLNEIRLSKGMKGAVAGAMMGLGAAGGAQAGEWDADTSQMKGDTWLSGPLFGKKGDPSKFAWEYDDEPKSEISPGEKYDRNVSPGDVQVPASGKTYKVGDKLPWSQSDLDGERTGKKPKHATPSHHVANAEEAAYLNMASELSQQGMSEQEVVSVLFPQARSSGITTLSMAAAYEAAVNLISHGSKIQQKQDIVASKQGSAEVNDRDAGRGRGESPPRHVTGSTARWKRGDDVNRVTSDRAKVGDDYSADAWHQQQIKRK